MEKQILENRGGWYKGNLHMHTTRSDGAMDRDAAIRLYRDHGYDFVCVTDHRINGEGEKKDGILVLPGSEWDTGDNIHSPIFHILSIGNTRPVRMPLSPRPEPEEIIRIIREAGGLAILAHPTWSVMDPTDIVRCKGITAAEIWNTVSGLPGNPDRADASLYFDLWAKHGILVPAVADDDTHAYQADACRSYIMAGASSCTPEEILRAIAEGNFYASQGPEIRSLTLNPETRTVTLTTSPDVACVYFSSNMAWSSFRIQEGYREKYQYEATPGETYLRVTLVDKAGRKAFSSPFPVL
jgi:hypothetical protein